MTIQNALLFDTTTLDGLQTKEAVQTKPEQTPEAPPILTVSEISHVLKRFVENGFRSVQIRGEISGFKRHSSGHSYFALKDESAVMDAVAWRGVALSMQPEDGLEVIITGRITTYPGRSKYQVVVESMKAAGKGALMALLNDRKERLQKEGVFNQSRPLPRFPKKIGIITSPTGAVIQDILHRLGERFPLDVLLWPTQVQGCDATEQVTRAILGMNALPVDQRPDVLIIARGGGSLEDLWTFNEEAVVRAVAASEIPTISAIGHETDTTLTDFAADLRAPTPTAAAEIATPVRTQLLTTLHHYQAQSSANLTKSLRVYWIQTKGLARGLIHPQCHPQSILEQSAQRLDDAFDRLKRTTNFGLNLAQQKLKAMAPKHPREIVAFHMHTFASLNGRCHRAFDTIYKHYQQDLTHLAMRLVQSSYTKILDKGFAFVSVDQTVVSGIEAFPDKATKVRLHFCDGVVEVTAPDGAVLGIVKEG